MKLSFNRAFDRWLKNKGERPALSWTLSILWLLLIGWLAFFWNLGSIGLIDETEPLFAEAARQMTVTGDWITPFFNGETRFDKPPLIYWLMAIAYSTLGVNEWAVRLPSALSAIGLVSLSFYTLWFFESKRTDEGVQSPAARGLGTRPYWLVAGLGAALVALNIETIAWARTGVSDMLLTACMGSALLSFFLGYAQPDKPEVQTRWYLAFYVLIALAVLTKGPVGLVLPVLIIGSFLLYLGNGREVLREMRVFWGSLLILAIALPWYILVIRANGWAYINSFFGYHNLERFTSVVNRHSAPWYFYLFVVLVGFAPWSIYLPLAMARLQFWQRSHWQDQQRSTQLSLFAFFWFIGVFGFFTIAVTKLPSYVLPLMPAAAILVALLWGESRGSQKTKSFAFFQLGGWLNVVFLLVLAAAIYCIPYFLGSDPAIPNLRSYIQQSGLPVVGGVIWAISAVAGALLLLRRRWHWLMPVNLVAFMAFLIFTVAPTYFLVDRARQLPLRQLSAIALAAEQPGEELIMIGFKKPSIVFYTQRPVTYYRRTAKAAEHIKEMADNATHPFSVLILSKPTNLHELALQPNEYQDLGQAGVYQLIRVFKSRSQKR